MIAILALAGAANAATFNVPSVYGTIQAGCDAAVAAGNAGDVVLVADGTYYENIVISGGTTPFTLMSENGPATTIIDGSYVDRCINFAMTGVTLDGFTLIHGGSPWVAGNAFTSNQGNNQIVQNCIIKRCGLNETGAAWNADPDGFFYGATGGMSYQPWTGLTLIDCEVYENAAWAGQGAVYKQYNGNGSLIDRCEIYGNFASYDGTFKFEGNTFWGPPHTFVNSMMTGNWVDSRGGIYVTHSPTQLDVLGCTIMDNLNGGYGVAFYTYAGTCRAVDSILYNNTCYGSDYSVEGGANVTLTNCDVIWTSGATVVSCFNADPLVVARGSGWTNHVGGGIYQANWTGGVYTPRVKGDYHLTETSPCIDAGVPDAALTADFDGDTRDATPDVGYDEIGGVEPAVADAQCQAYSYEGNDLDLDGTGSTGATTYAWTQTAGKVGGAIADPTAALTSVPTPEWDGSIELTVLEASLQFQLEVDGGDTDTCDCYVRIPGDANGDDRINAFDIARVRTLHAEADFNDDGGVNAFDLAILRTNSGRAR